MAKTHRGRARVHPDHRLLYVSPGRDAHPCPGGGAQGLVGPWWIQGCPDLLLGVGEMASQASLSLCPSVSRGHLEPLPSTLCQTVPEQNWSCAVLPICTCVFLLMHACSRAAFRGSEPEGAAQAGIPPCPVLAGAPGYRATRAASHGWPWAWTRTVIPEPGEAVLQCGGAGQDQGPTRAQVRGPPGGREGLST